MPPLAVDFPLFQPKWLLNGPHRQTVWALILEFFRGPLPAGQTINFPMPDGRPDVLIGSYHAPDPASDRPLLFIVHGLPGDEDSSTVKQTARFFIAKNYPVLRLNLRGAGPSTGQTDQLYHAGRTEDIRRVLKQLKSSHAEKCQHGIVLMGFSFGGNMVLKLLGEGDYGDKLLAGAAVSAAIDLESVAEHQAQFDWLSKRLYEKPMLESAKRQANAADDVLNLWGDAIVQATTFYEFDEYFFAVFSGFNDVPHYYQESSSLSKLLDVDVPTLVIHAPRDPVAPLDPYLGFNWMLNQNLYPLLYAHGGHVGFHARGLSQAWHDECARRFFDAVMVA